MQSYQAIPESDTQDDIYENFDSFPTEVGGPSQDGFSSYDFGMASVGYPQGPGPLFGAAPMVMEQPAGDGGYLGRRPPMSALAARKPQTTQGPGADPTARPMTSVKAAGYTSHARVATGQTRGVFDPMAGRGPAPPLQKRSENSPEDMARDMEKKVNRLIEESAAATRSGDTAGALDKAKQAAKAEKALCKQREQAGLADQINIDLTYSVSFNLAVQYHANGMFTEALHAYSAIVKNKQYAHCGRLRVNMGNIYFEQKKYPLAIKMYRMALDQIPNTGKELRFKIMRNIGIALVKLGHFADAIQSFEAIMDGHPDLPTGLNLLLCYFALGDKDKMKKYFAKLLDINTPQLDADADDGAQHDRAHEHLTHDDLKEELKLRQREAMDVVTIGAKLIAPAIEKDVYAGYDYVIERLKVSKYGDIASEMEISKALTFLKKRRLDQALEALKMFEKKDARFLARAATNLSFLYLVEGDLKNADKYATVAVAEDRFNARALVNKGNIAYSKGEWLAAKELYAEAVAVESECIQALYNLGLVNKQLEVYEDAISNFVKIHARIPNNTQVIYQLASISELMDDVGNATKWFKILTSQVPSDAAVLSRLGALASRGDDESQAYHYHHEAYRQLPTNMDVISWLGAFFVKTEGYEEAIKYFERAAQIQPQQVKWQLMIASCHRRIGSYNCALAIYQQVHDLYPDNVECLRYLVHISNELGKREQAQAYSLKLRKAEHTEQELAQGRRPGTGAGSGRARAVPATSLSRLSTAGSASPPEPGGTTDPDGGRSTVASIGIDVSGGGRASGATGTRHGGSLSQPVPAAGETDDQEWGDEESVQQLLPL